MLSRELVLAVPHAPKSSLMNWINHGIKWPSLLVDIPQQTLDVVSILWCQYSVVGAGGPWRIQNTLCVSSCTKLKGICSELPKQ